MESDESLHELTGVRMAPAADTASMSGLAPRKGSSRELRSGVDPCQGSSLSSPPLCTHVNIKIFLGGKVCDYEVSHEKNLHPPQKNLPLYDICVAMPHVVTPHPDY